MQLSSCSFGHSFLNVLPRPLILRPPILTLLLITSAIINAEEGASTYFDAGVLKQLGISPETTEHLKSGAKFSPGNHRVKVFVNGQAKEVIGATFDHSGNLVFEQDLLKHAGLKTPDRAKTKTVSHDFMTAYPQTRVELRPSKGEVSIITSPDALLPAAKVMEHYERGGTAGLFNYELIGADTRYGQNHAHYFSTNTELGLNTHNWIFRSKQITTSHNNKVQPLYTYAQKNIGQDHQTLQFGQINAIDSVFAGVPVTGVQVVPEQALKRKNSSIIINGIAQSQARVEVRQAGMLIYTAIVNPGAFALTDITPALGLIKFDVEVIESNGDINSFSVHNTPAEASHEDLFSYSVTAGKLNTYGQPGVEKPVMISGTGNWSLSDELALSAGLALSDNSYEAMGTSLDNQFTPQTRLSIRNVTSHHKKRNTVGTQTDLSLNSQFQNTVNLGGYISHQSSGFTQFQETLSLPKQTKGDNQQNTQFSISAGWASLSHGNFTTSLTTSTQRYSSGRQMYGSWNKTFKRATLSVNVQKSTTDFSNDDLYAEKRRDTRVASYFKIDIPLGTTRTVSTFMNTANNSSSFGTTYDDRTHERLSYRLSTDRNTARNTNSFSGSLNKLSNSHQARLGYSQSNRESTALNGQLRGAIALHDEGVTFSPYHLNDTFAVASVSDTPDVKLNTPNGPVWTDSKGRALISNIQPYHATRIDISTPSLPKNTDVMNASKTLRPGRGSVVKADYPVLTSRRVLLSASYDHGNKPAKGAAVYTANNTFLTTVIDDGKIFLNDAKPNEVLHIRDGDDGPCTISVPPAKPSDSQEFFERFNVVCTLEKNT